MNEIECANEISVEKNPSTGDNQAGRRTYIKRKINFFMIL